MLITNHYSKDYVSGVYSLDRCLVKAYSQQTKEMNGSTGKLDTADMIKSFVYSTTRGSYELLQSNGINVHYKLHLQIS